MAMLRIVRVEHRGQRIDFARPNVVDAERLPLLRDVSDWYERGSIPQVIGYEQGESISATVALDNSGGLAFAALAYPLGATVTIIDDGETVLTAQCVRYSVGPVIELGIEV